MPDTKLPTEPVPPSRPIPALGLKEKAPPKPARRVSSFPAALAVSGTASRIPPAPRPPRPPTKTRSSQPKVAVSPTNVLDEGPVTATLRPEPPRSAGSMLVLGALAASLLASTAWLLREPAAVPGPAPATAARDDARPTSLHAPAPAPAEAPASRSVVLDEVTVTAAPPVADTRVMGAAPSVARPATERPEVHDETQPRPDAQTAEPEAMATQESPAAVTLPAFDANAAKIALGASALAASSCRKGDDPRGTAEVIVTFAPSGRVTSANVTGAPYGGTATGGCIAATLRSASVPAFAGRHVTVRKLVTIR